jgi:hypothetical protein
VRGSSIVLPGSGVIALFAVSWKPKSRQHRLGFQLDQVGVLALRCQQTVLSAVPEREKAVLEKKVLQMHENGREQPLLFVQSL